MKQVVAQGFGAYYERIRRRVHELVAPLDEAQFWTRPYPYGNSIGHLVLHLTGNMQFYMGTQILGTAYVRDRPLEFSDTGRRPKAEVLKAFDAAIDVVLEALKAQGPDDWGRPYAAAGVTLEEVPDRFAAFLRSAAHADQHLGQMIYIRKQLELGERAVTGLLLAAWLLGAPAAAARVDTLVSAALAQTRTTVVYDGRYRRIPYPNGDVPANVGVCTDVVIRAYRAIGVDLQQRVHEDMARAFASYPKAWGLTRPDSNIDHRRVPNLQAYLKRQKAELAVTTTGADYQAGDLVTWRLPGALPHIGLVSDRRTADGARPLIVHNIGRGPELEDMLFRFEVTGHYRYLAE